MKNKVKKSYKVILLGDPAVGKSSIRRRYLGEGFSGSYNMTLGADFAITRIGDRIIQIWDLAGHKLFQNIREVYYTGVEGIILVFDLTRLSSLNNLGYWIDEVMSFHKSKIPFVVVGNKSDLYEDTSLQDMQEIVTEFIQDLSDYTLSDSIKYIETSALLGKNIEQVFDDLITEMDLVYDESLGTEDSDKPTTQVAKVSESKATSETDKSVQKPEGLFD
ncbi:MAG: Rab family GTPase [Candidatus Hodarchaeales archaeon]|jgi:small GTP-binding protein